MFINSDFYFQNSLMKCQTAVLYFSGCSCLHAAAQTGQTAIAAYLIAKGMVCLEIPLSSFLAGVLLVIILNVSC